jgi:hypothetical protein
MSRTEMVVASYQTRNRDRYMDRLELPTRPIGSRAIAFLCVVGIAGALVIGLVAR